MLLPVLIGGDIENISCICAQNRNSDFEEILLKKQVAEPLLEHISDRFLNQCIPVFQFGVQGKKMRVICENILVVLLQFIYLEMELGGV